MKILVCGGRDYQDYEFIQYVLDELLFDLDEEESVTIIHGGATGADTIAGEWARLRRCTVQVFLADWSTHGNAAGPIRNKQMLDEGKPDLVIAFPGGRGTANMVAQAKAAGVRVIEASITWKR